MEKQLTLTLKVIPDLNILKIPVLEVFPKGSSYNDCMENESYPAASSERAIEIALRYDTYDAYMRDFI